MVSIEEILDISESLSVELAHAQLDEQDDQKIETYTELAVSAS